LGSLELTLIERFAKHFERVGGISLLKIQYPECFPVTCPGKLPFPRSGSKPSSITSTTAANSLATPATLQSAAISTVDSARSNRLSGLESIADLQKLANLLRQVGYAEPDVEGVMHADWIRFFRKAWGPPHNPSRKDSRDSDVPALHFTHQVVAGSGTQRHDGKRRILAGAGGKP